MEKLIESLPEVISHGRDKFNQERLSGLCLHFRPAEKMWSVGYGRNHKATDPKTGLGYSIIEAVEDFKSKLKINGK